MGPPGSCSEGGEPSNVGTPPPTFGFNKSDPDAHCNNDRLDPIHQYLLHRETDGRNDSLDPLSPLLKGWGIPDVPHAQDSTEPSEMDREEAIALVMEMMKASGPLTVDMAQAAAKPSTMEMGPSDPSPAKVEMEALVPLALQADASGRSANMGARRGESSAAWAAHITERSIVPYRPFLPRMILSGEINPGDHLKYSGSVETKRKAKCADVAISHPKTAKRRSSGKVVKPSPETWLPMGWTYKDVLRTSGATAGRVDRVEDPTPQDAMTPKNRGGDAELQRHIKYYYSPDKRKFRSKVAVQSFIHHGEVVKEGRPKRKNASTSDAQDNIQEQAKRIPPPTGGYPKSLRDIKRLIRSHGNNC